jgi:hypothetical protein
MEMGRFARSTWLPVGVALAWGGLMALEWREYRDPLTGFGLRGYIFYVGLHLLLAANAALAFSRRWRMFGSLLAALALFLAPTVPSKSGVKVRVTNATTTPAQLTVARMDDTASRIMLSVPPGQTVTYRTAPGDYPEDTRFAIEHGSRRLPVTIAELRQHRVCFTGSQILLEKNVSTSPVDGASL